jgi:hypothetical protein
MTTPPPRPRPLMRRSKRSLAGCGSRAAQGRRRRTPTAEAQRLRPCRCRLGPAIGITPIFAGGYPSAEGRGREAVVAYEHALLLEPTRMRWRCALVEILLREGQRQEAPRHGATILFDAEWHPGPSIRRPWCASRVS